MKYIIATKEEIEINVGDQVKLIEEYQSKFAGYFEVVEALETYLVIDFKENGIFGFSPVLIESVKRAEAELPADLAPQIIAVVKEALPELVNQVVQDVIKATVTPEFVESLLPGVIDKKVKEILSESFINIGTSLKG